MEMIKSTINITKENKEKLEMLVQMKKIASLTDGINEAIRLFLEEQQKRDYENRMAMAAMDEQFMKRTMILQEEFEGFGPYEEDGDDEW